MAEIEQKIEGNKEGEYYTDENCTGCELCVNTASNNFTMINDHAVVYKQPKSEEEKTACEEALSACPVSAIGNDGA